MSQNECTNYFEWKQQFETKEKAEPKDIEIERKKKRELFDKWFAKL